MGLLCFVKTCFFFKKPGFETTGWLDFKKNVFFSNLTIF